jgi:hypothetical protein
MWREIEAASSLGVDVTQFCRAVGADGHCENRPLLNRRVLDWLDEG